MRIFLVVIAIVSFGLSACSNGDGDESFTAKHEWSVLQNVEFKNRESVPDAPSVQSVEGYNLLSLAGSNVVPNTNRRRHIWVMLWPKSPPFYKQMPEGNFDISQEELLQLLREKKVSSTVYEALRSHMGQQR